jgi:uncharacterized protein UPF0182
VANATGSVTSPLRTACAPTPNPDSAVCHLRGAVRLAPLNVLLTDWWWFREIGYGIVFTRELTTRLLLFLAAGGLTAGVLYLNLRVAQRGLVPYPVVLRFKEAAPRADMTGSGAARPSHTHPPCLPPPP